MNFKFPEPDRVENSRGNKYGSPRLTFSVGAEVVKLGVHTSKAATSLRVTSPAPVPGLGPLGPPNE